MPLLAAEQLAALPPFDGPPRTEAVFEWQRRLSTASYRLYTTWAPEEEWFVLKYGAASGAVLCLHRFGRDDSRSEIVAPTLADLEAMRGPQSQVAALDGGFVPVSIRELLR